MQVEKDELVLEICYFLQKLQITLKYNDIFYFLHFKPIDTRKR